MQNQAETRQDYTIQYKRTQDYTTKDNTRRGKIRSKSKMKAETKTEAKTRTR
jgi:hypothetical protein